MGDYIVDDLFEIKALGSPFSSAWNGCLFIGTKEACIRWVEEHEQGGTDNGSSNEEKILHGAPRRPGDG